MDATCPICSKSVSRALLERHVNSCLDTQESANGSQDQEEVVIVSEDVSKKRRSNPLLSLGLKMDSKKPKVDKGTKNRPSLTKLLIEERRLKKEREDRLAKGDPGVSSDPDFQGSQDHLSQASKEPKAISQVQTPPKRSLILQKSEELAQLRREASIPLAQRLRPKSLGDYFGQEKLLGKNGLLRNIIQADHVPSFILWGVPGVGKTTLARIIASNSSSKFVELSGSQSNSKDLREVFTQATNEKSLTGRSTILFLDEIHRFNKGVQDLLLPVIEKGVLTVIGATTENPSFTLNNALLSRMHTFVMEPLSTEAVSKVINRGLYQVNRLRKSLYKLHFISLNKDAVKYLAELAMGDSRVALNLLESVNAYFSTDEFSTANKDRTGVVHLTAEMLKPLLSSRNFHQMYDRVGESHYDTISAFHKSVRGSDPDAAVFYLTKMLSGGEDPMFLIRRMIVIASEDIGLRDSSCLPFAVAAKEALEFVGMPEGEIILAHCAVKLARAPKSTKSYRALRTAQALLTEHPEYTKLPIPLHIRNAPTKLMKELGYGESYRYNPNFKHGKVHQSYLPPELEGTKFVEDVHLGTQLDENVLEDAYKKAEQLDKEYKEFKKKKKNELKQKYMHALRQHSYDENLPKEAQPEYFDGNEKDEYSDDPDCTNNFSHPYDEFLDRESQPEYFGEE
ncbi:P-loop containing nucleoside triphosphate hydrolase protein, partial [Suhomyces tanzawaensis NRRL Y-17324]